MTDLEREKAAARINELIAEKSANAEGWLPNRHHPDCCSRRGCHPDVCSHGKLRPDGSLRCGMWESMPTQNTSAKVGE